MPIKQARNAQGRFMKAESANTAREIRKGIEADATPAAISPVNDEATATLEKAAVARSAAPQYREAQDRARQGDDSMLLPYQPTPSINPPRPRTVAGGYNRDQEVLTIKFRDGAMYDYYGVPQNVWKNFRRTKSPGRFINRTLNGYSYNRRTDLEG